MIAAPDSRLVGAFDLPIQASSGTLIVLWSGGSTRGEFAEMVDGGRRKGGSGPHFLGCLVAGYWFNLIKVWVKLGAYCSVSPFGLLWFGCNWAEMLLDWFGLNLGLNG